MSRKHWRDVKVVTTNRAHECGVCSEEIPKGAKALNESGRSEIGGYFNSYFHLERSKGCYLDFMECVWSDGEEAKLILSNIIEDKPVPPMFIGDVNNDCIRCRVRAAIFAQEDGRRAI